ncbi:hypothetical protein B5X24_HaOG206710 [Helicoverpa armigera]|uniref:Uncharacterized protein n=1 Tax=Helicoverpa armigera TaxID=29058 RepID=A0A2W1BJU7_HELAM|nr:hypothetical protein B5X24_HaOG206710 [Helicoverpa armigera]
MASTADFGHGGYSHLRRSASCAGHIIVHEHLLGHRRLLSRLVDSVEGSGSVEARWGGLCPAVGHYRLNLTFAKPKFALVQPTHESEGDGKLVGVSETAIQLSATTNQCIQAFNPASQSFGVFPRKRSTNIT